MLVGLGFVCTFSVYFLLIKNQFVLGFFIVFPCICSLGRFKFDSQHHAYMLPEEICLQNNHYVLYRTS